MSDFVDNDRPAKSEASQVNERGRMAWRPIESAPQDGSEILILTEIGVTQARFGAAEWTSTINGTECDGPLWICCDDTWEIEIEDCGEHGMNHGMATHWMPLPEAPSNVRSDHQSDASASETGIVP